MVQDELCNRVCCLDVLQGQRQRGFEQDNADFGSSSYQAYLHDLAWALFHHCSEFDDMACLPQAAFAVNKLRNQNEKNMTVSRLMTEKQDSPRYLNNKTPDLTALNYSAKMMNSIWGLYNRYSPHNFKKNNGSDQGFFGMQQPFAVACSASDKKYSEAKN
ncbi:uncharacterized protein LOC129744464 [Uranotaenia lowii]|uniref:uncharacterized protein LOC129744464 n=1 Tax=Uranotaenia lowii TaxID=190385 RepID=UPI0024798B6D|nr:uncharacterized protein LOC129744464 [Uranotaenia lowii]